MEMTSAQCRSQEAIQRLRAKDEPLENVRNVAVMAAIAWGQAATIAERIEARRKRASVIGAIMRVERLSTVDDAESA